MIEKIHLTVGTTCVKDGKVLMVEEKQNGRLVINQPAGHVEPGETLKGAALRETLEETGYHIELTAILGLSAFPAKNGITYYRVSFLASCPDQTPRANLDPDIERAFWMTPDEISRADNHRSQMVQMDIDRFLNGRKFPLDMIAENP